MRNGVFMKPLDDEIIGKAFELLCGILDVEGANAYHLVVCGGAALRIMCLHQRTTKDVDVLAFIDNATGD